jgi:hypothetical protein
MPGTTNFLQHNPSESNQETDATYLGDATRTGGIATDQIMASTWMNKIWYQSSTFITAFANMMVNKGYTVLDTSLTNLTAAFASVLTLADVTAAYLIGVLGFTPVQQGTGVGQDNILPIKLGQDASASTRIRATIGSVDHGDLAYLSDTIANSGGLRIQQGATGSSAPSQTVTFATPFSATPIVILGAFGGSANLQAVSATGFTASVSEVTNLGWIALGPQ